MGRLFLPFLICLLRSSSHWVVCVGDNRLLPGNRISVNQTIASPGGTFALGFFSPAKSTGNRYIGIWYNSIPDKTVVWVANREAPLVDASGVLTVMADGNIALIDGKGVPLWSSNLTGIPVNTSAVLLDTGNFVLRDSEDNVLWKSFDHPADTYLPTMEISLNIKTGKGIGLVAWKDPQDPSPGNFSLGVDRKSMLQLTIREGSKVLWRSHPWRARQAFVVGNLSSSDAITISFWISEEESRMVSMATGLLLLSRYTLDTSGKLNLFFWDPRGNSWSLLSSFPSRACDIYKPCGASSFCELEGSARSCRCLQGFEPTNVKEWEARNFSRGCLRKVPLRLNREDRFLRYEAMKLPDDFSIRWDRTAEQCMGECLDDGQCTAYAIANLSGGDQIGSRCLVWSGELIDLVRTPNSGEDLYVRVASAELEEIVGKPSKKKHGAIIAITVALALALLSLLFWGYCICRKRNRKAEAMIEDGTRRQSINSGLTDENNNDLPLFDLGTMALATNNFSDGNKIGKGGFGYVYKGKFAGGQEVAVKRLSSESGEGIEEFKTEARLIAKLQHRNLVRLLGCCIEGGERLLVYEYMPNRSLDFFIFGDEQKRLFLDWEKRLDIILGVARGLLYLHQDSRLRVIHRDLKAANILLDEAMNPKISDFGTARIFGRDQMDDNTIKIVGTIGYMSPEYIMSGNFSEKSDIFSFGVLVLEIISGRKNQWTSQKNFHMELLANAWRLWKENHCDKLLEDKLRPPCQFSDVLRFIQVGLLCVQESPDDRPTMQEAVFMLANRNSVLPRPEKPGFFKPTTLVAAAEWFADGYNSSSSVNMITLTNVEGR